MTLSDPVLQLLQKMPEWNASDLHFQSDVAPYIRIEGALRQIDCRPLKKEELDAFAKAVFTERQRTLWEDRGSVDFAYRLNEHIRFRVNIYNQRGTTSMAFRLIDCRLKTFEGLHLPAVLEDISEEKRGIILVTGAAGSGKSTTMAVMIDHINSSRAEHVITVEDPIEYVHHNKHSLIEQREIGTDAKDFNLALTHVLRQDPDVILIGEIRDLETVVMTIRAALTGHLVFSTLHTIGAVQTLVRLLQYYKREEREAIQGELALAMRAVISQRLVIGKDQKRCPNIEIMVVKGVVPKLLREGRWDDLVTSIKGREFGMQTFDQSLVFLHQAGLIAFEEGMRYADDPGGFKRMAQGGFSADDRGAIVG